MSSSNYITNSASEASQHTEYLPFGETFVDEHLNSHNTPFKFNAKEFDDETGNYYYGARYYNPKWSTWLSVDPLAEEAPDWTPYRYGFHNPLKYIDPTGMSEEDGIYIDANGNKIGEDALGRSDGRVYVVDGKDKEKVIEATLNGQTVETSELTNYAELPSNDIKQAEDQPIQDGKKDTTREYSYVRVEYSNGNQPYDFYDKGEPFSKGASKVNVYPVKNMSKERKPFGLIKHMAHVHNFVDPSGDVVMLSRPSQQDKKTVKKHSYSTHAVHDTRNNSTYVMRSTGKTGIFSKKVVIIKMSTSVYQRKSY